MNKLIFIFLISFFNSLMAQDDTNCKYTNLMEDNWLKLRNQVRTNDRYVDMPAYDQGRTGTCYAFAATQLVDYWRQSHGFMPEERIALSSPIHMALVYKMGMSEKGKLQGGNIFSAVMALKKYGLCPKTVVAKDLEKFLGVKLGEYKPTGPGQKEFLGFKLPWSKPGTGVRVEDDVIFAELTQGFIVRQTGALGGDGHYNSLNPNNLEFSNYLSWAKGKNQREIIKEIDKETLKKIYDALTPYFREGNYLDFLEKVLISCNNKSNQIPYLNQMPSPRNFDTFSFQDAKNRNFIQTEDEYNSMRKNIYRDLVRSLLNRKNAPAVGIAYCSAVLKNPGRTYLNKVGYPAPDCGPHASILVGKRELDGKCQYLLKNSWNSPDICNKNSGCIYHEVTDPETKTNYKEEVGAWINEDDILNNVHFISYIYPETAEEKEIEAKWKRIEEKYFQAGKIFTKQLEDIRNKKK